jgi:2-polyprenyl-3-methyl-5-hydroxy-6-metoxy-1,4-benzoquinol methylase
VTADGGYLSPEAAEHYATGYEATRLFGSPQGELERLRSQEIISRSLPKPPARVIDVGGAGGVYSLWLLDQGYEVVLIDAMPEHVELAERTLGEHANRHLASARLGDARNLAEAADSADAVLLMGPLYHLTDRGDRVQSLREAKRVLKPDGVLFAAAISRFASLLDGLTRNLVDDPAFQPILEADLKSGQHRNPTNRPDYFTTAFFHHPDELTAEVAEAGFRVEALIAVEGPAWILPNLAERMADAAKRRQLLDLLRKVETDPALLGMSAHLLAVARKW